MANESIDKLASMLAETLPQGLRSLREDLEENFRTVLASGLGKLELVTREEFEVGQAVLARTRDKLEALEARLATMEAAAVPGKSAQKAVKKAAVKKPAKKNAAKKNAAGKKAAKKM